MIIARLQFLGGAKVNKADGPLNQKGFELFKANKVRRINPTHFLVKTENGIGSFVVELQEGKWVCNCNQKLEECEHRYAIRLAAVSQRLQEEPSDDSKLVCRYCGSPDISRCGFRYNAYGISRRLRCNECLRKFSVKYTDSSVGPSEMTWLIAEVGTVLTKLEELIDRVFITGFGPTDELRLKLRRSHQD
jgi:transposase-like protein